jgi:hypothetical protein
MQALRRIVRAALTAGAMTWLCAVPVLAGTLEANDGWTTERGVDPPSYAMIEPRSRNLNIDVVVLACEQADDRPVLQLQLYLTNDGPLMPHGAGAGRAKSDPRAEIAIDDDVFPVALLFADDHVVLGDETHRIFPRLSDRLLDAIEQGTTMRLRFDLVAEPAGQPAAFDGEAVVNLRAGSAGAGGKAVAAVRRCAPAEELQNVALSGAGHWN